MQIVNEVFQNNVLIFSVKKIFNYTENTKLFATYQPHQKRMSQIRKFSL